VTQTVLIKRCKTYLGERHHPNVTVFCSGGHCRNNVAGWPVTSVTPTHQTKDFAFFTAKDLAMAREADVGLMVWDGKSTGTMVNAARMVAANKPVVVYLSPGRHFSTVRSYSDLDELLSHCPLDIPRRIDGYIAEHAGDYARSRLF
jgi:nucleoside 2-deoxyribosyltransferase